MTGRRESPNLRQTVIRAAEAANVPLVDYDRALVLRQVAGLLGAHPKIGGMAPGDGATTNGVPFRRKGTPRPFELGMDQRTLYRSKGVMTLFALYVVGFACERTYHRPAVVNLNVVRASPAPSMKTSRLVTKR